MEILKTADMPILLMTLVQLTGNKKWMEEPYLPARDLAFFADESGGFTPKHHHPWEHEVLILSGVGELECAGEMTKIKQGDGLFIPSEDLHQFRATGDRPLEFLCIVPVESACGQDVPGS